MELLEDAGVALLVEGGGVDCNVTTGGFTIVLSEPPPSAGVEKCSSGICLMTAVMPS